jgi:hypothetical protein
LPHRSSGTPLRMCLACPCPVAQTFLSAGLGDFPVPKVIEEHGAGKHREPADKNVCATKAKQVSADEPPKPAHNKCCVNL